MASSPSLEDSESDYIESSAESSSSSGSNSKSNASGLPSEEEEISIAAFKKSSKPPALPSHRNASADHNHADLSSEDEDKDEDEDEEEIEKKRGKPYNFSTKSNVYAASSSNVTISGRRLDIRHSKPASADEILFHNPSNPSFVLPDSVKNILEDQKVTGNLPDSDLLKVVHRYVAEFFAAKGWDEVMTRSMDESAMLAIGVILEEYCREMIGKDGDMVFAERNK
ncbi:hypothetical protein TWF481_012277 [Arthrobotrys musiformis]|uniref:Uncharacterized protein n=1 Tax=Arthrobotrys musiformis TaxID=47236 RepID=A0AAV9VWJ2_9PEZI